MGELPNRRPHYMVKVHYREPHRSYELTLFCGCGLDPRSGRVVEVFVRPGRVHEGETPDMRDAMLERLCDDIGRLISFHLQMGVFPQLLEQRLNVGAGPGEAMFPAQRPPDFVLSGLSSPLGAIVRACCIAQEDMTAQIKQLAADQVPGHA